MAPLTADGPCRWHPPGRLVRAGGDSR